MLKKFIVTVALMGVTAYSYGQGSVNFDTKAVGARVTYTVQLSPAPASPATGNNPLTSQPFYGQLYAAAGQNVAPDALQPVGTKLPFRGAGNPLSSNAGFLQDLTPVEVTSTAGGAATVQLRAWTGAETYEAALGSTAIGTGAGASAPLNLAATGNPLADPPTTPPDLVGLQGFNFEVRNIPEPSTVALGVLGAAALLFARRRK